MGTRKSPIEAPLSVKPSPPPAPPGRIFKTGGATGQGPEITEQISEDFEKINRRVGRVERDVEELQGREPRLSRFNLELVKPGDTVVFMLEGASLNQRKEAREVAEKSMPKSVKVLIVDSRVGIHVMRPEDCPVCATEEGSAEEGTGEELP